MRARCLAAILGLFSLAPGQPPAVAGEPDLPVIEVPPANAATDAPLFVMLSGDGGWAEFVRDIAERLSQRGWPAVGLDLRRYLWTRRTPQATAMAVDQLIREYSAKWHRSRVVLAGFSRGADIAPFVVNRLPPATRDRVALVVLLSPGEEAEFEFHLLDFVRDPRAAGRLPVRPELDAVHLPVLLLYGKNDREAMVPPADSDALHAVPFPGDHHLGREYDRIVALIEAAAQPRRRASTK